MCPAPTRARGSPTRLENIQTQKIGFVGGCARGAEKASCGETVVQKGVFWRVRFLSAPLRFSDVLRTKNLKGQRNPRGRAPKVPKECAPESQKSPRRVRNLTFGLFSDSFETPGRTLWALLGPCPGAYSFRTLFGLFRASGPEGLGRPCVGGGADCKPRIPPESAREIGSAPGSATESAVPC